MIVITRRPNRPRRGVTLVEMLVVVALVILMMTILVQIFQSATGAMTASRTTQELDVVLRQIDSMIRADLVGTTAKMTPPNDPANKSGYFEYGENAPADAQGEDSDDYLAFTTKAPENQVFSGRQWLYHIDPTTKKQTINQSIQPITITSQIAEVIYFLRNGNLYRRVFLVAPERADSIASAATSVYGTSMFGQSLNASWQGVNDISCRPNNFVSASTRSTAPLPNDLGHLTNRENRAFRPRFVNDFNPLDGIPDDNNGDGIPDYYPTLYFDGAGLQRTDSGGGKIGWAPNLSVNEVISFFPSPPKGSERIKTVANGYDVYAFPFIYPGMYSVPAGATVSGTAPNVKVTPPAGNLGWRHGLFPTTDPTTGQPIYNHNPLDLGDSLPAPTLAQTWWGFPTWRETMTGVTASTGWGDPISSVSGGGKQPFGLSPFPPGNSYLLTSGTFLPPLSTYGPTNPPTFSDGAGSGTFIARPAAPAQLWDDELILTGVRSFDVKAYDTDAPLYNIQDPKSGAFLNGPFSAGYQDLGYGAEYNSGATLYAFGPNGSVSAPTTSTGAPWQHAGQEPVGFGHVGRIPSLWGDFRGHPRRGYNIGDDSPGIIRLNRVWDSWSTDYTNAPDSDIALNGYSNFVPAIYPSFPPPYPSPLRGIQIQIRVVDPRNERSKVLTIRHDFTDKL